MPPSFDNTDAPPPGGDEKARPTLQAVPSHNDGSVQDDAAAPTRGANDEALLIQISGLQEEHADLGKAIDAMAILPGNDGLALARLKKRKLALKDKILQLKDRLTPDIIA